MLGVFNNRYRCWSAVFLVIALAMLVLGQTLWRGVLGNVGELVFWMICFVATMLAILMAFLDLSMVQRRARQQQRELIEGTLDGIVRHKNERNGGDNNSKRER